MSKPDDSIIKSGHLDVGDGNKIFWEDWGNPAGFPIIFLHGGPGGGIQTRHKLAFNPSKHRVIFFDQRGAGKSTPYASIKNNTTQDLISDIVKLRKHLKIEQAHLLGRSWGSALALAYSIAYPESVKHMLIGGIYFGTAFENDFISAGYVKYTYPEAWDRFIALVPEYHRASGTSITQYYADKMNSSDLKEAKKYADEWTLWEASTLSINYDKRRLEAEVLSEDNLAIAKLEAHYFLNNCFMPDNYILDNIDKIKHIPCYVVQGRFDNCTPPITAYKLSKAYGKNLTLQWVNAGHSGKEPEIFAAEKAVANTFLL
ncbi:MAG: prolyl aminopeptidase [Candidatus Saccharimonadales bacterium]